jgi:RNase adapter protein RapZ
MSAENQLILVTGMSGAGKSVALKTLEDIGFEAVDNIPLSILPLLINGSSDASRFLAVGVDIRNRDFFSKKLSTQLKSLQKRPGWNTRLLFLDCDDEILQRRFTETRRKHPVSIDRPITDGISHEREMLAELREQADIVVDSSSFTVIDLKQWIRSNFSTGNDIALSIIVTSFSFRQGLPREADLVFDVRFLQNPHYVDHLRELDGRDAPIADYIARDESYPQFFANLTGMLLPLLPRYQQEGKSYLTIAIGCTGGKHRSVFVTEQLGAVLTAQGYRVVVKHRELEK